MNDHSFILVADNIRSLENIGTFFRVGDAFGAEAVYIVGISGYPDLGEQDTRRPWLRERNTRAIKKTALSGFESMPFKYFPTIDECIVAIKKKGCSIVCIEQDPRAKKLESVQSIPFPCCFVFGNEVTGVSQEFLAAADLILELTQQGKGKSLNVSVMAGIVCYISSYLV